MGTANEIEKLVETKNMSFESGAAKCRDMKEVNILADKLMDKGLLTYGEYMAALYSLSKRQMFCRQLYV